MSKRTSGEWFNKSWNPINGRCLNNCADLNGEPYCWMWRPGGIGDRFKKTHDHPLCLNEKILNHIPISGRVFVGSSTDMWHKTISERWKQIVLEECRRNETSNVTYFFLTKTPNSYQVALELSLLSLPKNCWFGTTSDGTNFTEFNVMQLKSINLRNRFVSFEPLLSKPEENLEGIKWIIIGADSRKGKPKPPKEWADYLIQEARRVGAMVLVKDNYGYPERIKEMP